MLSIKNKILINNFFVSKFNNQKFEKLNFNCFGKFSIEFSKSIKKKKNLTPVNGLLWLLFKWNNQILYPHSFYTKTIFNNGKNASIKQTFDNYSSKCRSFKHLIKIIFFFFFFSEQRISIFQGFLIKPAVFYLNSQKRDSIKCSLKSYSINSELIEHLDSLLLSSDLIWNLKFLKINYWNKRFLTTAKYRRFFFKFYNFNVL